ncbi:hypothetical protein [Paenibacillus sp. SI8]|uniref:hypothetical protein n=1 Tax=unclassified Paenibacillus TaxID=185978 RepID=UPI0034668C75
MIRFQSVMRKYEVAYVLISQGQSGRDADGVYRKGVSERATLRGVIQPLGAKLIQGEGGRYTEDDRVLYTAYKHENGQIVEYEGSQYRVIVDGDRFGQCDTNKFVLKRVTSHDPLP